MLAYIAKPGCSVEQRDESDLTDQQITKHHTKYARQTKRLHEENPTVILS